MMNEKYDLDIHKKILGIYNVIYPENLEILKKISFIR